ncbi:MAG: histidine triad family protein [Actinomycetota bacterium]|jgi:histidine triad (HIT) family protein|nr:histidine triad family protein [Actinomycetota bacterium]
MSTDPGTTDSTGDCLFCKIIAREIPADIVHETATTLAFRDIKPQAPTHVLVIPKEHQPDVAALGASSARGVADLFEVVGAVALQEGLEDGYRSVFNTGAAAGQEVFHAHVHVLGGRTMTWPPG